jgi:hypothetical protein
LNGDGGSVQTSQWINSITSTGTLGDLFLASSQGVHDVTAPSILGNVDVPTGSITGPIQTTGSRIDPLNGQPTPVSAVFGRLYTIPNSTTKTVTFVHSDQTLSGSIISRGNLISQVNADTNLTGLVAAQGTIGIYDSASNTRFGGVQSGGALSGRVVTLADILGDLNFKGGLKSGRITAGGSIRGNTIIGGTFDLTSAIVAVGNIGDSTFQTALSVPTVSGFIAAIGKVTFSNTPNSTTLSRTISQATGTNATEINYIFSYLPNGSATNTLILNFDLTGEPSPYATPAPALTGLNLIVADFAALSFSNGTLGGLTQ